LLLARKEDDSLIPFGFSLRNRSCQIHEETMIGEGTEIDDRSSISRSIIGRNCQIGTNVVIIDSYIWDSVILKDNICLEKSIVCSGARILNNSKVEQGCVIGFDVVIGPDFTVPQLTKLTTYIGHVVMEDNEDGGEIVNEIRDIDLGENGFGRVWIENENERRNNSLSKFHSREEFLFF